MGKNRKRHRQKSLDITQEELNAVRTTKIREQNRKKDLQPRNVNQKHYDSLLTDWSRSIVLALGPAGTGKTLFAVHHAIRSFNCGEIKKIIITRPAVSVHESHGFLPGGLVDKMMPWIRPIYDIMTDYWSPQHVKWLMESELVEIAPLAYMRGRTFKDAWIIADEMQNATPEQMKMLLTRIGDRSRIVATGDLAQHDRGFENNGLKHFVELAKRNNSKNISLIEFDRADVERHPVVNEVLGLYGEKQYSEEANSTWQVIK